MSDQNFDPSKANIRKEGAEFAKTLWANYKVETILFFTTFLLILTPMFGLGIFIGSLAITFYATRYLNKRMQVKRQGWLLGIPIWFVALILLSIPAAALHPQPVTREIVREDKSALDKLERDNQELQKQVLGERERNQQLQNQIDAATKINSDYDTGSDVGSQEMTVAQEANKAIAALGSTTKDQKLFVVTQVVDGDTIKVSELGTIRLIGIDTPETKDPRKVVQCFGEEASKKATEVLMEKKVWLEFDPANRMDKYNRTLAYVYREDGLFVNKMLVGEGFAHSYTKYPHPKMDEFNAAQKSAQEGKKGLWSDSTCNGDTEQAAVKETPVVAPTPTPTPAPVVVTPSPAPAPTPSPAPAVSCPANCTEARQRGMAPIYRGDQCYPGNSSKYDRDNDGIGCE